MPIELAKYFNHRGDNNYDVCLETDFPFPHTSCSEKISRGVEHTDRIGEVFQPPRR